MPRRARALAALGVTLAILAPAAARAEGPVATATGQVLVSSPRGVGGGGSLSLAATVARFAHDRGVLRLGGLLGAAALTSDDDQVVRTWASVGPQLELAWTPGALELALRVAAGGWAGGLDQALRAGGFASAGAWATLAASDALRLGVGVDVGLVFGPRADLVVYAPGVTLAWTLPTEEGF